MTTTAITSSPERTTPRAFNVSPWLLYGAAGLALGLAHADSRLGLLAWVGVAVLGFATSLPQRLRSAIGGLTLLGILDLWVGHPWQIWSAWMYSGHRYGLTALIVLGFTLANVVPRLLPVALGLAMTTKPRLPVALWLPGAWLIGEHLRGQLSHMRYNDWLITQSHLSSSLKAVGYLGWTLGGLVCLTAAALFGEAIARRSFRWAGVAVAALIALMAVPAQPKAPADLLEQVGAVHMSSYASPPKTCPPGVRLLIWPEHTNYRRPRIKEGPGKGKRITPPLATREVSHIYGLITRTLAGWHNSLLALAPDGRIVASRAKVHLFPLVERPLLGLALPTEFPLVAGHAPASLPTPLGPVVSVICLEGLERAYIRGEVQDDTRLISISANEKVFGGSALAMRQFVDVAILMAVENHRPVVRASLYGTAAIVDQDGTVLAVSRPGTDGVLTTKAGHSSQVAE